MTLMGLIFRGRWDPFVVLAYAFMGALEVFFRRQPILRSFRSNLLSVVVALFFMWLIRGYVVDVIPIPNDRFAPTVPAGARVVVQRTFMHIAPEDLVIVTRGVHPHQISLARIVRIHDDGHLEVITKSQAGTERSLTRRDVEGKVIYILK